MKSLISILIGITMFFIGSIFIDFPYSFIVVFLSIYFIIKGITNIKN